MLDGFASRAATRVAERTRTKRTKKYASQNPPPGKVITNVTEAAISPHVRCHSKRVTAIRHAELRKLVQVLNS